MSLAEFQDSTVKSLFLASGACIRSLLWLFHLIISCITKFCFWKNGYNEYWTPMHLHLSIATLSWHLQSLIVWIYYYSEISVYMSVIVYLWLTNWYCNLAQSLSLLMAELHSWYFDTYLRTFGWITKFLHLVCWWMRHYTKVDFYVEQYAKKHIPPFGFRISVSPVFRDWYSALSIMNHHQPNVQRISKINYFQNW